MGFTCLLLVLGFFLLPGLGVAQTAPRITLAWDYTNRPENLATGFVVQRCQKIGSTPCTLVDLPGATTLPLTPLTYVDTTIQANLLYCYAVRAFNVGGRSLPSPTPPTEVCGGSFDLAVPTTLRLTITTP